MSTLLSMLMAAGPAPVGTSADELLQRGRDNYGAAHYNEAIADLKQAADSYMSPAAMQTYVNTGHFESLDKYETAMVYLALAYEKAGREGDARDAILHIATAERIEPRYAKLALDPETAEFEPLAQKLAPAMPLPANLALAQARGVAPVPPPPAPAAEAAAAPQSTTTAAPQSTTTAAPAPAAPTSTEPKLAVQPTMAAQRQAEEEKIAAERAAAEQRIAAARTEADRQAQEQIAAARAEADRAAQQKIAEEKAAAEQAAQQRIAEERAAAQKAADERIAAERAAIAKQADERIAAERAAAQRAAEEKVAAAEAEARRNQVMALRQADAFAENGNLDEANAAYARILDSSDASREALTATAVGFYRTGDFPHAVQAFQKLGTFARGEEDLRYYNAVALYETGRYDQARHELACSLPFIQITSDVARYREKIERMAGQQASK